MNVAIRKSTAEDADSIGSLAAEFHSYLRALGDKATFDWNGEKYLRDGFGSNPAFEGLVAEADSRVVAYALYHFGYDTDQGQRLVYLIDLFVSQQWRRHGIGEKLMHKLSELGRAGGAEWIVWHVFRKNAEAISFYDKLGARSENELHVMCLPIRTAPVGIDSDV